MEFIEEEEIRAITAHVHACHGTILRATKKADRRHIGDVLYTLALRLENMISPEAKKYPTKSEVPVARLCERIARMEHRYVRMMDSPYLKVVPDAGKPLRERLATLYLTLQIVAGL